MSFYLESGDRLRAARESKGWSLKMASEKSKVSVGSWTRFETGVGYPGADTLMHMCEALEVSIDYIMFGDRGKYRSVFSEFDALPSTDKVIIYDTLQDYKELSPKDKEIIGVLVKSLKRYRKGK